MEENTSLGRRARHNTRQARHTRAENRPQCTGNQGSPSHHAVFAAAAAVLLRVLEHGHGGCREVAAGGRLLGGVLPGLLVVGDFRGPPHGLAGVDALGPEPVKLEGDVRLREFVTR